MAIDAIYVVLGGDASSKLEIFHGNVCKSYS